MRWRSRALVLGALAASVAAVVFAVQSALDATGDTGGVLAAQATIRPAVTVTHVGGARVRVVRRSNGAVCFRVLGRPGLAGCMSSFGATQISYAVDPDRSGRQRVAGIAGSHVQAVIAKLTRRGTVWAELNDGAFYAVFPPGHRLRALVKVLPGGVRRTFPIT